MTEEGNYECVRRLSRRESNRGQYGEGRRNRGPLKEAFGSEGPKGRITLWESVWHHNISIVLRRGGKTQTYKTIKFRYL